MIEVLITSLIIGIVSAIVVARYGAFNSSVLLKNQAYEIALSIREAQAFTISVRGQEGSFLGEYGIFVDVSGGSAQEFMLFSDSDSGGTDGSYDVGEEIETFTIDSRFQISNVCLYDVNDLSNDDFDCNGDILSIMFERPDFDAVLVSDSMPSGMVVQGEIVLSSVSGVPLTRSVIITSAGQISVE